jgi:hypothetical protein
LAPFFAGGSLHEFQGRLWGEAPAFVHMVKIGSGGLSVEKCGFDADADSGNHGLN